MQSFPRQDGRTWLRPVPGRTAPARARLFCFPYAGAGATVFRGWGPGLPEGVEALAVQLPGREDRFLDQPVDDLDGLMTALVPGLLPFLDRPFAFFGHSMGAIICWELCRRLRDEQGFRADLSLFTSYVHRPSDPLTCPVMVFGGSADPRVDVEHLKGWADLTTGPCDVQVFEGGHFFLTTQQTGVLEAMSRALAGGGIS
ncbi:MULTISPECIES: thioesterase domain-containing protein [unclassified Streptomyces]|uniref:thioesterase II family protein n=1 Tax=unclassified Streptomyces TaxID=2593676 RepID=UPI003369BDCE